MNARDWLRTARAKAPTLAPMLFYVLAAGLPAVANFALTPLLVARLGAHGFAAWALIEPLIMIGGSVACLGVQFGNLNRVSTDLTSPAAALGVALAVIGVTGFGGLVIALPIYALSFGLVTGLWLALAQMAEAVAMNITNILRAGRRSGAYAAFEGGRYVVVALIVAAAVALTAGWFRNLNDVLATKAIVTAVGVGLAMAVLVRPTKPDVAAVRATLGYGMAIFGGQILLLLTASIDRYIGAIAGFSAAAMTSYVVHARVAGMLNVLLLAPLNLWFPVEAMKRDISVEGEFFHRISVVVIVGFLGVIMALELGMPLLWRYLFPSVTLNMPLLMVSVGVVALQGMAVVWNVGALRSGHTSWNMVPPLVSLTIMVLSGLVLGRIAGPIGVASSRLVAAAVYALLFRTISQRITGGHEPLKRLLWFAPAAAIAVLPTFLPTLGGLWTTLIVLAGLVATGLAAAASFGLMTMSGRATGVR